METSVTTRGSRRSAGIDLGRVRGFRAAASSLGRFLDEFGPIVAGIIELALQRQDRQGVLVERP